MNGYRNMLLIIAFIKLSAILSGSLISMTALNASAYQVGADRCIGARTFTKQSPPADASEKVKKSSDFVFPMSKQQSSAFEPHATTEQDIIDQLTQEQQQQEQ